MEKKIQHSNGHDYNNYNANVKRRQQQALGPLEADLLPKSIVQKDNAQNNPTWGLPAFEYTESQIQLLDIIGCGDHAIVFRIAAGGRTFALKVHKYELHDISSSVYPKPNQYLDRELMAYAKLAHLQHSFKPSPIPHCFGYLDLTRPIQALPEGRKARHPFRSRTYLPAVYLDFLRLPSTDNKSWLEQADGGLRWRDYFQNKSLKCVLRGLVLEEVTARNFRDADLLGGNGSSLAASGLQGLSRIHKAGVLHGDVKNIENALVAFPDERVIWIDFSMAQSCLDIDQRTFKKMCAKEMSRWKAYFISCV